MVDWSCAIYGHNSLNLHDDFLLCWLMHIVYMLWALPMTYVDEHLLLGIHGQSGFSFDCHFLLWLLGNLIAGLMCISLLDIHIYCISLSISQRFTLYTSISSFISRNSFLIVSIQVYLYFSEIHGYTVCIQVFINFSGICISLLYTGTFSFILQRFISIMYIYTYIYPVISQRAIYIVYILVYVYFLEFHIYCVYTGIYIYLFLRDLYVAMSQFISVEK